MAIRDADGTVYANVDELWAVVQRKVEERQNNPNYRPASISPRVQAETAQADVAARRHVHTWVCTDASCPGNGFPTREELISGHLSKRARFDRRAQSAFDAPNQRAAHSPDDIPV